MIKELEISNVDEIFGDFRITVEKETPFLYLDKTDPRQLLLFSDYYSIKRLVMYPKDKKDPAYVRVKTTEFDWCIQGMDERIIYESLTYDNGKRTIDFDINSGMFVDESGIMISGLEYSGALSIINGFSIKEEYEPVMLFARDVEKEKQALEFINSNIGLFFNDVEFIDNNYYVHHKSFSNGIRLSEEGSGFNSLVKLMTAIYSENYSIVNFSSYHPILMRQILEWASKAIKKESQLFLTGYWNLNENYLKTVTFI